MNLLTRLKIAILKMRTNKAKRDTLKLIQRFNKKWGIINGLTKTENRFRQ
jgi:hypothetical protein